MGQSRIKSILIFCIISSGKCNEFRRQWNGNKIYWDWPNMDHLPTIKPFKGWSYDDNIAEDPRFHGDLSDRSKWLYHWEPPYRYSFQFYKDWMADYKRREAEREKAYREKQKWDPEKRPSDWPRHWTNLGPANTGDAPPPWAIDEHGYGKLELCFLPPKIGHCKNYHVRWGYNPYVGDCREFVYSDCGGNANNFYSKERCREACVIQELPCHGCILPKQLKETLEIKWLPFWKEEWVFKWVGPREDAPPTTPEPTTTETITTTKKMKITTTTNKKILRDNENYSAQESRDSSYDTYSYNTWL